MNVHVLSLMILACYGPAIPLELLKPAGRDTAVQRAASPPIRSYNRCRSDEVSFIVSGFERADPSASLPKANTMPAAAAMPVRLAMTAVPTNGSNVLRLDLALPRAGATFEMFDVQGRRVMRRDFGDLTPGTHHVSLPAAELAPGVYWARVRLGEEKATSRVTLLR